MRLHDCVYLSCYFQHSLWFQSNFAGIVTASLSISSPVSSPEASSW